MYVSQKSDLTVELHASAVVVSCKNRVAARVGGGSRKDITEFSSTSRLRMLRALHNLVFSSCLLITLTYDKDFPVDSRIYQAHLQAFRKWFERRYGKKIVVWRLEFQKREAPHFHLVVLTDERVCIPCCSLAWHRISGCASLAHLKVGFDVKGVSGEENVKNVGAYIAKYISKVGDIDNSHGVKKTGRFWGIWNKGESNTIRLYMECRFLPSFIDDVLRLSGFEGDPYVHFDPFACTVFTGQVGDNSSQLKIIDLIRKAGYIDSLISKETVDYERSAIVELTRLRALFGGLDCRISVCAEDKKYYGDFHR